jgi:hypothetical protein
MSALEMIRQMVRELLDERSDADPHSVVEEAFHAMSRAQREEAALFGLHKMVTEITRNDRESPAKGKQSKAGPTRWAVARRQPYNVNGEWKWLEECRVDDLLAIADDYKARAAAETAKEVEFRKLARDLARSPYETVGEMIAA